MCTIKGSMGTMPYRTYTVRYLQCTGCSTQRTWCPIRWTGRTWWIHTPPFKDILFYMSRHKIINVFIDFVHDVRPQRTWCPQLAFRIYKYTGNLLQCTWWLAQCTQRGIRCTQGSQLHFDVAFVKTTWDLLFLNLKIPWARRGINWFECRLYMLNLCTFHTNLVYMCSWGRLSYTS